MQTQKLLIVVVYTILILFLYLFIKLLSLSSLADDQQVEVVEVRQLGPVHISSFISPHLTSRELTPFHLNGLLVLTTQSTTPIHRPTPLTTPYVIRIESAVLPQYTFTIYHMPSVCMYVRLCLRL